MGIDPSLLPDHIQQQIRRKTAGGRPSPAIKARSVPQDSTMNKTERRYSELLEKRRINGEIIAWRHEPLNIRLAKKCFYKPDFLVISNEGYVEIHEVKGSTFRDDALVKIKAAADKLPWFIFVAAYWKDPQWTYRRFE